MLIKNETYELEISETSGVYFGSKTSGQHFRKWEDCGEDEKRRIKTIRRAAEALLRTSERIFFDDLKPD